MHRSRHRPRTKKVEKLRRMRWLHGSRLNQNDAPGPSIRGGELLGVCSTERGFPLPWCATSHGSYWAGSTSVLPSRLTAVCASNLPLIDAPVRNVTDV